ncbi:MAG: molybdopterin converting factor subunit 1 [Betaproteobacteria bacterium RIFCSPLOWO2_12_FULL_68_19]|nr:MAG: molybdopterin converting factor subunit 1 [Betaproteobacteria bacterium RIFCSPLOWO2_12_FULL_68_19]
MKVKVLFFAGLREQLGTSAEEIDLPAGVSTVAGLRSHLQARGGAYEKAFAGKALVRSAVNQDMVPQSARIKAGDEVAFFPPVTGG